MMALLRIPLVAAHFAVFLFVGFLLTRGDR